MPSIKLDGRFDPTSIRQKSVTGILTCSESTPRVLPRKVSKCIVNRIPLARRRSRKDRWLLILLSRSIQQQFLRESCQLTRPRWATLPPSVQRADSYRSASQRCRPCCASLTHSFRGRQKILVHHPRESVVKTSKQRTFQASCAAKQLTPYLQRRRAAGRDSRSGGGKASGARKTFAFSTLLAPLRLVPARGAHVAL